MLRHQLLSQRWEASESILAEWIKQSKSMDSAPAVGLEPIVAASVSFTCPKQT